jgi:DNA-binding GntR family transcriptional regulator
MNIAEIQTFEPGESGIALEERAKLAQHNSGNEQPRASDRRSLLNDIRLLLLSDRSENDDTALSLIGQRKLSERVLGQYVARARSRIPIREALAVLRTLGIISSSDEHKKCQVNTIAPTDTDRISAIRCELVANGDAAVERLVETSSSKADLTDRIAPALSELDKARAKAEANSVRERGDGVLHVTEAIASIASAANLARAADVIRSGLDVLEISIRATSDNAESLSTDAVRERIAVAENLLEKISEVKWSETFDPSDVTLLSAQTSFQQYVDSRLDALRRTSHHLVQDNPRNLVRS